MNAGASPRTLAELKDEILARAARNAYPVVGYALDDIREGLDAIDSLDGAVWAAAWSAIADRYAERGETLAAAGSPHALGAFRQAWRVYSLARWPVPNSPGKRAAYEKALSAFRKCLRLSGGATEVVRIPYEATEIVGYFRAPGGSTPSPAVLAISGLDSRKEDLSERFDLLAARGIAYLVLDSPGTGEAPAWADPVANAMFATALEYLRGRPDVDAGRIAVYGGSFGGHWATRLALSGVPGIAAAVAQSPPVHHALMPDHSRKIASNREYLFDYLAAAMSIFQAVSTFEELLEARARLSLEADLLREHRTPPMLVIGGVLDTQVPFADLELLLRSGAEPKEAWINPVGGHMGRGAAGWSDQAIFERVTAPWLERRLRSPAA